MTRVDDLDDLDPDEVSTTRMSVPRAPTAPNPEPPTPAPYVPETTPIAASPRDDTADRTPTTAFASSEPTQAYSAVNYAEDELPTTTALAEPADAEPTLPVAAAPAVDEQETRRRKRRDDEEDDDYAPARTGRGTLDLGLLILRVAVGAIAMAHGMQKLFGWWNGPGLDGFESFLVNSQNTSVGFVPDAARPLAIVGALSESIGGLLLILGLATPLAASAVLGVMIIATTFKATVAGGIWFFATGQSGPGLEYEILLAICAAAIILTGPGRISLDAPRGWSRRPSWGSALILVLAIAVAVAVWVVFNGSNPADLL